MRAKSSSEKNDLESLFTPVGDAIDQLRLRKADRQLVEAVGEFLEFDIPTEFNGDQPLLYLPRHLATPSFEVLFAIELAREYSTGLVIGQDKGGKFVGHNEMKRSLGKLPIVIGNDKRGNDIVENRTIVDFAIAQGKPMSEVLTVYGIRLPELHAILVQEYLPEYVRIVDETGWINRCARDDISKQYRRMLAYSCAHVAMVEWFVPAEDEFLERVVLPAFEEIRREFGIHPLIAQLMEPERDTERNWNAYPGGVLRRLEALEQDTTTTGRKVPL